MPGSDSDVLVIGAGPAGSSAATLLAEYGHRVRLVDRSRFPRPRIGESLPPKIWGLLAVLGLQDEVEQAGFARMRGTVVHLGDELRFHEFDPEVGRRGYQVDRGRFDQLLLDRAQAAGAEVALEVAAQTLIEADGRVAGATLQTPSGPVEARARFVIDATGGAAWGARALGLRRRDDVRTVALAGYWSQTAVPPDFEATATLFEMLPDGWIWSLLRQDGLRNITLGIDASLVKGPDNLPADLYLERVRASRLVGSLIERADLAVPLKAYDATWARSERYTAPGILFAGDAASVIDPLTSQGVYKAMQSGIIAAAVVNTAIARPQDEPMATAYYSSSQTRFEANYAEIARSFYRASPYAASPFWSARVRDEARAPDELAIDEVEARGSRRAAFRGHVEVQGGLRTWLTAAPGLAVDSRAAAEGGFIVQRDAFVFEGEAIETLRVEPRLLAPMLDGRAMGPLFDAYAEAIGEPPSRGLGRRLMVALSNLVERGAVDFSVGPAE